MSETLDLPQVLARPVPEVPDDPFAADAGNAVTVAYVNGNMVTYSWHHSLVELIGWDLANHGRILRGGYVAIRHGHEGLVAARNMAVKTFLAERDGDWLFWIDTDQGFAADTVDRLLAAADPVARPVVGALAFSLREMDPDGVGGWRTRATPTVFDWAQIKIMDDDDRQVGEQQGFRVRWDYPANTVTRVAGTGSACILVHRSAFERVAEKYGPVWYDSFPNISTGDLVSEDLSFCIRLGTLDVPVHVHTGVQTTHQKTIWLAEGDYWRQRAVDPAPRTLEQELGVAGNG